MLPPRLILATLGLLLTGQFAFAQGRSEVVLVTVTKLATSDPSSKGRFVKKIPVKLVGGKSYTLEMTAEFDTLMVLEGPKGAVAQNDDISETDRNSRIKYTATVSATYHVLATSFVPGKTGQFRLVVTQDNGGVAKVDPKKAEPKEEPVAGGKILDTVGQLAKGDPTFNGRFVKKLPVKLISGKSYTLNLSSTQFDTLLALESPTGSVVAQNDDVDATTLNSQIKYTAPVSGTFQIRATSYEPGKTGQFRLVVTQDNGGVAKVDPKKTEPKEEPVAGGKILDTVGQLAKGDPTSNGRFVKKLPVKLIGGKSYTLDLTSTQFDTLLALQGPTGSVVAQNDDVGGGNLNSRIKCTASVSGTFQILATSFEAGKTGAFRIVVTQDGSVVAKVDPKKTDPIGGTKKPLPPVDPVIGKKTVPTKIDLTKSHPAVRKVVDSLQDFASKNGGSLPLSKLGGISRGLDKIESVLSKAGIHNGGPIQISGVKVGDDGSVQGSMSFRNKTVSVILQHFPPNATGVPQWSLAIKYPDMASDLIPAPVLNAMKGQLTLRPPVFVISSLLDEIELDSTQMSNVTRSFYSPLYEDADFTVTMKPGIRFSAAASLKPTTFKALKKFKFEIDNRLEIEGSLLSKFPLDGGSLVGLVKSKGKSLMEGVSLKATLPKIKTPLPSNIGDLGVAQAGAYIEVTGTPSVELGWVMVLIPKKDPSNKKTFLNKMKLSADIFEGSASLTFVANMTGTDKVGLWKDALGVKGFDVEELTFLVGIDTDLNLSVGAQGRWGLLVPGFKERKVMDMAGKVAVTFKTGIPAPSDLAIRCGSEKYPIKLNTDELVLVVNYLIQTANPKAKRIRSGAIPNIEIDKFYFSVAPKGGDSDLKIDDGLGFSGALNFEGKRLLDVAAKLNWTDNPSALVKGKLANFDLKGLSVRDVAVDLLLSSSDIGGSHFMLSGNIQLLGSSKFVKVSLEKERLYFNFKDKVNGVFETDFLCDMKTTERTWKFHGNVKTELANIGAQASREVEKWAKSANADFDKADKDLQKALASLKSLETQLVARRKASQAELDRVKKEMNRLRANKKAKQDVWNALGRFVPNVFKRDAKAALDGAIGSYNNFVKSAGWAADAVGPDANPAVIELKARIETAKLGVNAARGVVTLTGKATAESLKVTAYALKNPPIVVDQMKMEGNVSAQSLLNVSVQVNINYRYLGQSRTFRGSIQGRNLTVNGIANELKKAVGL